MNHVINRFVSDCVHVFPNFWNPCPTRDNSYMLCTGTGPMFCSFIAEYSQVFLFTIIFSLQTVKKSQSNKHPLPNPTFPIGKSVSDITIYTDYIRICIFVMQYFFSFLVFQHFLYIHVYILPPKITLQNPNNGAALLTNFCCVTPKAHFYHHHL